MRERGPRNRAIFPLHAGTENGNFRRPRLPMPSRSPLPRFLATTRRKNRGPRGGEEESSSTTSGRIFGNTRRSPENATGNCGASEIEALRRLYGRTSFDFITLSRANIGVDKRSDISRAREISRLYPREYQNRSRSRCCKILLLNFSPLSVVFLMKIFKTTRHAASRSSLWSRLKKGGLDSACALEGIERIT